MISARLMAKLVTQFKLKIDIPDIISQVYLLTHICKFLKSFDHKGIQPAHAQKIANILDRFDAAVAIQNMKYPGSNLHLLKGKLKVTWSVKVSGNWRLTFKFQDGNAYVVDYQDYN